MLKTEKEINSRFANEWDLDDEDYNKELERLDTTIGRYPVGFRHFESYENYKI